MLKAQCSMNLRSLIKKTFLYRHIYQPYRVKREKADANRKHAIFVQHGAEVLVRFAKCMQEEGLDYWLEFGTLLGAYRDGAFVPNELDLDVGAYLRDASRIHQALAQKGFRLVREFHVIGEDNMEQTYEYEGVTLDVMYFVQKDGQMWCYGAFYDPWRCPLDKPFYHQITAHYFKPFSLGKLTFLGTEMKVPANTEEHLMEIFGMGYKVYDPDFKGDLNKIFYAWEEKSGIGFIKY